MSGYRNSFALAVATAACLLLPTANSAPVIECGEIADLDLRDMKFGRSIINLTAALVEGAEEAPAHCSISGRIFPEIDFAAKLPIDWNGRFVMTGSGGAGGSLRPEGLNTLVARGYAAAGDDTGHEGRGDDFSFAYNPDDNSNPHAAQKLEDLAYRSIHETTSLTKQVIAAYYGQDAEYSYYYGASQGGRQGLKNAQMYPEDFDGWSVGYPVLDISGTTMADIWNLRATFLAEQEVTPEKMPTLAEAVLAQCDIADGLDDGLISAPMDCDFDPAEDLPICPASAETDDCFTPAQVGALKKVYSGPINSKGEELFYPPPPGSEQMAPTSSFPGAPPPPLPTASLWDNGTVVGWRNNDIMTARSGGLGSTFVKYVIYQDPEMDWSDDFYDSYADASADVARIIDAVDPDLDALAAGGKKILHYHGLADALVTPYQSIAYYESVQKMLGAAGSLNFYKLDLIPGMGHGASVSVGPSFPQQDWLEILVSWVELGIEPMAIVATRPANEAANLAAMSRPLCPYPTIAVYDGDGNTSDARNFSCSM